MPDDGIGFGDYPDLGKVSTDMKSDWENWDDPYGKRNFGDPVWRLLFKKKLNFVFLLNSMQIKSIIFKPSY
jgi:hypothetical protein